MELNLRDRTAVITGGSMGIGKAIAKGLAAEGANIVLLARTQETLNTVAEEIRSESKVQVLPLAADITDSQCVES